MARRRDPAVSVRAALAAALLVVCSGCYGAQFFKAPVNADKTQKDVQELRAQQAELLRIMGELQKKMTEEADASRQSRADQQSKLDELAEQISVVQSKLDDMEYRVSGVAQKVDTVRERLRRPDTTAATVPAPPPAGTDPQALYDAAYRDVTRGNFDLAVNGFREYLKLYPETELSDNALYWIGECHYATKDFPTAIADFDSVLVKFPDGDKVASALLKKGYAELQAGDTAAAKKTLGDVVKRFPASPEAKTAKEKLASL